MADLSILKYNAGNIFSVVNAFKRLGIEPLVTDDPDALVHSSHVVIPGQGEAGTTMSYLRRRGLDKVLLSLRQPVLGICIGMQLMCRHSEEDDTTCLGIFDAEVKRFHPSCVSDKVPQMGWNTFGEDGFFAFSNGVQRFPILRTRPCLPWATSVPRSQTSWSILMNIKIP